MTLLPLLLACREPTVIKSDSGYQTIECPSGFIPDDVGACVPELCGTGPYAGDGDVFVDAWAIEAGDGSRDSPLESIDKALSLMDGPMKVQVAAGTYETALKLDSAHDGLEVEGRCAELTRLNAPSDEAVVFLEGRAQVTLAGFTLVGGTLAVEQTRGSLSLTDIDVRSGTEGGILVTGSRASLVAEHVAVLDELDADRGADRMGFEIEVAATATLIDVSVSGAQGSGVYAHRGATLTAEGLRISGTRQGSAEIAVGVLLSESRSTLSDVEIVGELAAGVVISAGDASITSLTTTGVLGFGLWGVGGANIELARSSLSDTLAWGNSYGAGIELADASLLAEDTTVARSAGVGLIATGGEAILRRVHVADTDASALTVLGGGVVGLDGTELTLDACEITGTVGIGLLLVDANAEALNTVISGSKEQSYALGGAGVFVRDDAHLDFTGGRVEENEIAGILALGDGADVDIDGATVARNVPVRTDGYGRGMEVAHGAHASISDTTFEENYEVGLDVWGEGTAVLTNVEIVNTRRGLAADVATGLAVQSSGHVSAEGLVVTGTEGPGVYVTDGQLECDDGMLYGNGFAGLVLRSGFVYLRDSDVSDNTTDPAEGGGFGIFVDVSDETSLTIDGVTVGAHSVGGVQIQGAGRYEFVDTTIAGGPRVDIEHIEMHGHALLLADSPDLPSSPGDEGLWLERVSLTGSGGAGLFLHGATAALEDASLSGNSVDIRHQHCGAEPPSAGIPNDARVVDCPEWDEIWERYSFDLQLEPVDAAD